MNEELIGVSEELISFIILCIVVMYAMYIMYKGR